MSALVAVLAILVAVPLERPDACDVCPTDCPMHARRDDAASKARHLGCHRASEARSHASDAGGCTMRAGCGHHRTATTFHAVLTPRPSVHRVIVLQPIALATPPPLLAVAPAPPTGPPRLLSA
jgi:hypothetical protein